MQSIVVFSPKKDKNDELYLKTINEIEIIFDKIKEYLNMNDSFKLTYDSCIFNQLFQDNGYNVNFYIYKIILYAHHSNKNSEFLKICKVSEFNKYVDEAKLECILLIKKDLLERIKRINNGFNFTIESMIELLNC